MSSLYVLTWLCYEHRRPASILGLCSLRPGCLPFYFLWVKVSAMGEQVFDQIPRQLEQAEVCHALRWCTCKLSVAASKTPEILTHETEDPCSLMAAEASALVTMGL